MHTPIFGELRKPSSEKLYFGQRGFFFSTLVPFAELFLQKVFLLLLKINRRYSFSTFSTIQIKCYVFLCCSILLALSIIKQKRMRKNFISKVVLLVWEKTIWWSEFLFNLKTEKRWLQRRCENGLPIFARQCFRTMFCITSLRFRKIKIKIYQEVTLINPLPLIKCQKCRFWPF